MILRSNFQTGQDDMTRGDLKQAVIRVATEDVHSGSVGVGTGSTANFFIGELAQNQARDRWRYYYSPDISTQRLKSYGIRVLDMNSVGELRAYIDGASEITERQHLLKGDGETLTREKIVVAWSTKFVCVVGSGKLVGVLGRPV